MEIPPLIFAMTLEGQTLIPFGGMKVPKLKGSVSILLQTADSKEPALAFESRVISMLFPMIDMSEMVFLPGYIIY